jgi:hypothetical protein
MKKRKSASEDFKAKIKKKDLLTMDCRQQSITAIRSRLQSHPMMSRVDVLLLEYQPAFNVDTTPYMWAVYAMAPFLWPNKTVHVCFVHPKWKNQYCHLQGVNFVDKYKTWKTVNKKETVECCLKLLAKDDNALQKFQAFKKKDDVADSIVQCLAFMEFAWVQGWKSDVSVKPPVPADTKQLTIMSIDLATINFAVSMISFDFRGAPTMQYKVEDMQLWDLLNPDGNAERIGTAVMQKFKKKKRRRTAQDNSTTFQIDTTGLL